MNDLRKQIEQLVLQTLQELRPGMQEIAPLMQVSQLQTSSFTYGKRVPFVAANWKMNQLSASAKSFIIELQKLDRKNVQTVICAPHILLSQMAAERQYADLLLGAQNFYPETAGAFTGEHSLQMLADAGVNTVIIGHSERRNLFGEQDELLAKKLSTAIANNFLPIFCVGENLAERKNGSTFRVLYNQLTTGLSQIRPPFPDPDKIVFAYEPIWAIGTGVTATADQAEEAVAFVRERLVEKFSYAYAEKVRVLYGGSVNEKNTTSLAAKPSIDGFLVGNASLGVSTFASIIDQTAACKRMV
ncbi:triose-phosphate isomerase [Myxococcota bacterium]|nr:triose-phosphate isomerase [Myxococcota bacterium]